MRILDTTPRFGGRANSVMSLGSGPSLILNQQSKMMSNGSRWGVQSRMSTSEESLITVPSTNRADETSSKFMKAIVRTKFGPPEVLEFKDVEKPVPNNVRGVLVKIHAASVNPADRYGMIGPPFVLRIILPLFGLGMGVRRPKSRGLGTDAAGLVVAVSDNVTQFKPGDEVFGACNDSYAEYALAREDRIILKPANCSFEEAAAVPIAALTALQALRDKGQIQRGQRVLVNGAGGGVGTFAVQIAKAHGAEVTAVTNTQNLELAHSIGADHVIDYTQEDFTKNGQRYDLICDCASAHSISEYKRILNPKGKCVIVGSLGTPKMSRLLYFLIVSRLTRGDKKFRFFIAKITREDLTLLKEFLETGKVMPVIDRRYSLSETAEAIEYLGEGHARGKVVITVKHDHKT